MIRTWGAITAFTAMLLLSATTVSAGGGWGDHFKALDADKSGRISRTEWEAKWQSLKIEPVPTFTSMDTDVNNGIDEEEWAAAEKMAKAFPVSCKSASSSWCDKGY